MNESCTSCGGDGIKKPLEALKAHKDAVKRCPDCRGSGRAGRQLPRAVPQPWYSVKFKTPDGAIIRITLKAKDESGARLNARALLNQSLHCEML